MSELLQHNNEEISLDALTTLIFLIIPESQASITAPSIISKVQQLHRSTNTRIKNLATIYLEDYCTPEQLSFASNSQQS